MTHVCRGGALLAAALVLIAPLVARAQTLDELQKKIDEGRKAQQQKAAPKPAPAATPAAPAPAARLVISSDAACVLRIDGQRVATLAADEPHTATVQAGEALIDCMSTEDPEARVSTVRTVKAGEKSVLQLSVSGRVRELRASRQAAADETRRREETQRQDASRRAEQERQESVATRADASGGSARETSDLARRAGCMACHAMDKRVVGPSFADVAARYAGDRDAVVKLARKIRAGGSGVWTQVPMPPNPQVSETEAHTLAKWVLSVR